MIRQILWGYEEDLYETAEYAVAGYYLEYILYIHYRNSQNFLNKLEPGVVESNLSVIQAAWTGRSTKSRRSI